VYLCVCVCVCLSVCPAIRFHSSQRIFSKFGGNLLRVMTRSVGYICFVCTQCKCTFAYFGTDYVQICWEHATTHHKWQGLRIFHVHAPRARVQARMCERARDLAFSTDLLEIWREPSTGHDTWRGLYIVCLHATHARARARCVHTHNI
jgi:hypothetical protein